MKKILYITANPKSEEMSFSLSAGKEFLLLYKEKNPEDKIININLYDTNIPFIDNDVLNAWNKLKHGNFEELTESENSKVSGINKYTEQFIEADKYIFVTPMWNLSIPPLMKAYIDTICIAGKTFEYSSNGPVGLLKEKKGVHIHASGGVFSEGPAKKYDFGNGYIKAVFAFLGIDDVQSILIEGTTRSVPGPEALKSETSKRINEVMKYF